MDRETLLPLLIGLMLALAAHLGAAAGFTALSRVERELPSVKPRADLVIAELTVTEPRIVGQPVGVTVTIANPGKVAAADFTVEVMLDDRVLEKLTLNRTLSPEQTAVVSLPCLVNRAGLHRISATVDPETAIDESDESNNSREAFFVWLAGASAESLPPDLAVFRLHVDEPRIAKLPVKVTAHIANLGGSLSAGATVQLLVDNEPAGEPVTLPPIPPGGQQQHVQEVIVDTPGDHEVAVLIEPAPESNDADAANNRIARRLHWLEHEEIKSGQLAPSPLRMNWISQEEFEALVARRAKFDQATAQKTTDPVDVKQTPIDPTPPAPRPAVAMRSPSAQPAETSAEPQRITEPTPRPDQPSQRTPRLPDLPEAPVPTQAPQMAETPTNIAAAARSDDSTPPTMIPPVRNITEPPQPVTDSTPANSPKPAPPLAASPSPELTIKSPNVAIPPAPADNPLLPPATDVKPSDTVAMKAPLIAPDPAADPTDRSMNVDAPKSPTPMLAALPLPPKPELIPGSPQQERPLNRPDADRTALPRRPMQADKPDADGAALAATEASGSPTPPQPNQAPAAPSDPTTSPKQEREAIPVSRIEGEVKPGEVIARYGVEIRTINPRFSIVALRSSAPVNPVIEVVFNKAGEAIDARIKKSSGYANVDGPILTSLYKWTATGEPLQRLPGDLTLEIRILLNDLEE